MSMEIDWNNDEAVVRAAIGKLDVYGPSGDGCHIASNGDHIGYGNCLENMWKSARTHPSVVAWEKANEPAPVEGVVLPHKTIPVLCVVDVDEGIASAVKFLNSILGVRTFASCQGTIGEGGASPYPAQVLVHCSEEILQSLTTYFKIGERIGGECCYIHPRHGVEIPTYDGFLSYDKNLAEAIAQRDEARKEGTEGWQQYRTVLCELNEYKEAAEENLATARAHGREEGLREAARACHVSTNLDAERTILALIPKK